MADFRALRSKKTGKVMTEAELHQYDNMGGLSPGEVFDSYLKTGEYEPVTPSRTAGQWVTGFAENTARSAGRFVGDTLTGLATPVTSGITAAKDVWDWAAGNPRPEPPRASIGDVATQAKDYVVNRYGSLGNIGRTLYEDPVGAASDVATVLSLGSLGLGRVAPLAGKLGASANTVNRIARAGKAAAAYSDMVDPLTMPTAAYRRFRPGRIDHFSRKLYEDAIDPSISLTPEQSDAVVEMGLNKGIPVSRRGVKRAQRRIEAGNRAIEREVNSAPGTPVEPIPVMDAINNYAGEVAGGGHTTPRSALGTIGDKSREHFEHYWGAEPPKPAQPYVPAQAAVPAQPAQIDAQGNLVKPAQAAVPAQPAQPYIPEQPAVPPRPIPASDALKIRRGVNKRLGDEVIEYTNAVDKNFDKAVREGVNEELYRLFPNTKHVGMDQATAIRLKQEIDATVRSLRGKDINMQSAYAGSQAGKTLLGKPSAVGVAAIVKKVLTPELISELAISLKNPNRAPSSKAGKLISGKYRVRPKVNVAATAARSTRTETERKDSAQQAEEQARLMSDVPYGDYTEPPKAQRDPDDPFK